MKELLGLAAAFSLACICAELVSLMTDASWARRCIKAAAGLYILVVLLGIGGTSSAFTRWKLPQQSQPELREASDAFILTGAAAELEQDFSEQCQQRFGMFVQIRIALQKGEDNSVSAQAEAVFPPGTQETIRGQILDWLEQELGTRPDWREETRT